ncbi:MAG: ERF family protein [Clostridiaceae bacterium]|nr:ERF family protein [Clostridiaceae bacterium]
MNIYEKITAIMQDVQYLAKDDRVKFGTTDYKALSEEKVTAIMRAELLKHGLIVFPIEQTSNRNGSITHVDVKYRIVNVEKPDEYIEVVSCGDGADAQDKGSGKAMTYAYKYMWLRAFAIPTGEDPDKISTEELEETAKKAAEKAAKKAAENKPGARVPPNEDPHVLCDNCGTRFADYWDGHDLIKAEALAERSKKIYGRALCVKCARKANQ